MRLEDSRPFAMTLAARRMIARVCHEQGESRGLLGFAAADNHLHAELVTTRNFAGDFARYVEITLRARLPLGAPFEPARIRPLIDQQHAINTFRYIHRQQARHELAQDPLHEGTSLPDLLGLRVLDSALASRVRMHLPRLGRADIAALHPMMAAAIDDDLTPIHGEVLVEAAAAAFALTDLHGRSLDVARARRAAVHAAPRDLRSKPLGEILGLGVRAVRAMRALPADPIAVRAVRAQALLRMPSAAPARSHEKEQTDRPSAA